MHGFAKTRMFNLLVSQGVAAQFDQTVEQYRQVVSFYLNVFQEHQEILGNGEWLKITEHLTHTTRRNPLPRYDFDLQFPNYPSGMRRAAISEAYGSACSWGSSYLKWQTEKEKHEIKNRQRELAGKHPILFVKHPPQYPSDCRSWPSFYGTECKILDDHHVKVKLFIGGDYTYRKVALLESLTVPEGYLSGSPTLVHKAWGWELHFPIGLQKRLNLIKIDEQFFLPGFLFFKMPKAGSTPPNSSPVGKTSILGSGFLRRSSGYKNRPKAFPKANVSPKTCGTRSATSTTTSPTRYPGK
jgi:hypothetical protein